MDERTLGPRLASARELAVTELGAQELTPARLSAIMCDAFGGSDAAGAWDWRMAFDVMQSAAVELVRSRAGGLAPELALDAVATIAARLPTETRRSERQVQLQQFSTPLCWALVAACAAAPREGDLLLEPSAGTGALAGLAVSRLPQRKAGRTSGLPLLLNDIDPVRRALLALAFPATSVTGHDAEFIDDLLEPDEAPTLVLVNPPFASSLVRSADPTLALRHVISAAKRLAAGGRLVAILPAAAGPERQAVLWERFCREVRPLLRLVLPRTAFAPVGTSVETHLLVADKLLRGPVDRGPSPHQIRVADPGHALNVLSAELSCRRGIGDDIPRSAQTCSPARATAASGTGLPAASSPRILLPGRMGQGADAQHAATGASPLVVTPFDAPRDNPPVSDVYARYAPQRMAIVGAAPHPTMLVESLAMSSVVPPVPSTGQAPCLPERLVREGLLSEAQLETLVMAEESFRRDLPGMFREGEGGRLERDDASPEAQAYRRGYFLGDGTGCGKGRQVAGIMLAGWLAGRRKAVWVSRSSTLVEDAIRDWTDIGGAPTDIQPLSRWSPDEPVRLAQGILFVTYATLRSLGQSGRSRLDQVLDWLGPGFEGVIAFDEAHAMQNAGGSDGGRGVSAPSLQGLAGLRLQQALPRARILYVSATGATTVANLAYASRLGLWGQGSGYPFPSRESFVEAMEAGGVAAMEVVARDLKALGLYTARALSFEGVEYDVLEHALSPDQVQVYDSWARAFRIIHQHLARALEATGVTAPEGSGERGASAAKSAAISAFESTKQRFFGHLLQGMKMPTVIAALEADLGEGWAPVIQIVSTGEALLTRRLEALAPDEQLAAESLTPRDYVISYLEHAFPVQQMQRVEQEDGTVLAMPLHDSEGRPVLSREALALRDALIEDLLLLAPIPSALDQLIWHFGAERIAEVTGRGQRPLRDRDGQLRVERRSSSANSAETQAFLSGQKPILVFSDAGGTGRSYQAAPTVANQGRRRHYLLEPGWRADAAIQGLGRTHRAAQLSAPFFRVCTTDVHGEKRFTSTIARRLDTLGALTKGQRETASQGMFRAEDNLESPIARACLRALYKDIATGAEAPITLDTFTDWTGLKLLTSEGQLLEDLPPIQRFLNRILALPIAMQNAIFADFTGRIATATERARLAGTLDLGLETLRGDRITAGEAEALRTCPTTGAVTSLVPIRIETRLHYQAAAGVLAAHPSLAPAINSASGKAALIARRPRHAFDDQGALVLERRILRPAGESWLDEEAHARSHWTEVPPAAFVDAWDAEVATLPATDLRSFFLLTGLLLPIWRDIPGQSPRIYRAVTENGPALLGRALSVAEAAVIRGRFIAPDRTDPAGLLAAVVEAAQVVDLGRGLSLQRRRVAGRDRLEITGADRATLDWLRGLGCFSEIHQYTLRLFLPYGEGAATLAILKRILGVDETVTLDDGIAA